MINPLPARQPAVSLQEYGDNEIGHCQLSFSGAWLSKVKLLIIVISSHFYDWGADIRHKKHTRILVARVNTQA